MLNVEHLTLRLGGRLLFNDVSFRVSAGQRVALAGRNGQGKSTFFRVLTGEMGCDSGNPGECRQKLATFHVMSPRLCDCYPRGYC